jgi:hypothetical protein
MNEKQRFQMGLANLQAPIYDAIIAAS